MTVVAAALAACTWGDYDGPDTLGTRGDTSANPLPAAFEAAADPARLSDENILALMAVINGESILASRMAAQRAMMPEVRQLARAMTAAHTAQQQRMDSLAQAEGLTPAPPSYADTLQDRWRATRQALSEHRGRSFDRAYVTWIVAAHEERLDRLRPWVDAARQPAMSALLRQAVTDAEAHLARARAITIRPSSAPRSPLVDLRAA